MSKPLLPQNFSVNGVYDRHFPNSVISESSDLSAAELRQRYELLLEQGRTEYEDLDNNLQKLKELVIVHGIPVRPLYLTLWLATQNSICRKAVF